MPPPLATRVLDPYEIERTGIAAVLGRFEDHVSLVGVTAEADVILYGLRHERAGHDPELHTLLREDSATVIVLGWPADTHLALWAQSCGAHAHLSKALTGEQLVAGIERIHHSRDRSGMTPAGEHCHHHPEVHEAQLTSRELDVLGLITRGLTNQEIAGHLFISINSVKTYIRTAYRKINVSRRTQAVSWGLERGLGSRSADLPVQPAPLMGSEPVDEDRADGLGRHPSESSRLMAG